LNAVPNSGEAPGIEEKTYTYNRGLMKSAATLSFAYILVGAGVICFFWLMISKPPYDPIVDYIGGGFFLAIAVALAVNGFLGGIWCLKTAANEKISLMRDLASWTDRKGKKRVELDRKQVLSIREDIVNPIGRWGRLRCRVEGPSG